MREADGESGQTEKESTRGTLAAVLARMGKLEEARRYFATASGLYTGTPEDAQRYFATITGRHPAPALFGLRGIWEAEFKQITGDRAGAVTQTQAIHKVAEQNNLTYDQARCDTLLGLLALPNDPCGARQSLDVARTHASRSGDVEVQLRCYHLAAEIARAERAHDPARSEAEAGIHLADTCGFGHYAIELRLALARVHLDAAAPKAALQRAREALERSAHPECQYAWGEADGLHPCGVAHARLGEVELARQRLTAALARRERLTHPGLSETLSALARLSG